MACSFYTCNHHLLPITFFWVLDWVISSDIFSIGITGFIRAAIVNGILGMLALIAAIMSAVRLVRPGISLKQKLIRVVVIIICLIVSPLLLRPLFLDIPYINSPQTAYLDRLEFDDEMGIGDSPANYYLRGVDVDGERHSFEISEKDGKRGVRCCGQQRIMNCLQKFPIFPTPQP